MNTVIASSFDLASEILKDKIINLINKKPDSLICLAGGDTPLKLYGKLIEAEKKGKVSFENCRFISLDEWVGIGRETLGSCAETLYKNFYEKINVKNDNINFFNGKAKDLDLECQKMNEFISKNSGIDIIVLGVGINGHLGFNEPFCKDDNLAFISNLSETTISVGQKYFKNNIELKYGITLGMNQIYESKNIFVLAAGSKKSNIIKMALKEKPSNYIPLSLLQNKTNATLYLDREAASKL